MNLALLVAGVLSLALPGLTAPLGLRMAPDEWARLGTASLRTGLWALRAGLALTAVSAVVHTSHMAHVADVCHHMANSVLPGGPPVGAGAAAALVVLEAQLARARRASRSAGRRLLVEPWLGRHEDRGDHEFVIVPTDRALAYAGAGTPAQVVVSQGLVDSVSDNELAAIVRHELCHLAHGHHRHLTFAAALDTGLGFLPGVRRSTSVVRLALERWADEAAAATDDRATVRRALEKVVRSLLAAPVVAPAFTAADTIRARLVALSSGPSSVAARWRLAVATPAFLLTAGTTAAVLATPLVHHSLLNLVGRCLS